MKKKVLIVSYYDWWNIRQKYYAEWFLKEGYQIEYITSDFNHITKEKKSLSKIPEFGQMIEVPTYKNNLSLKRIYSNLYFSKEIINYLKTNKYDIIVCLLPCNSLGFALKFYKLKNSNAKIVIDILDLWPETLPFSKLKYLLVPVLFVWKYMRHMAINSADIIVTECSLFKEKISSELMNKDNYVLYLQKNRGYKLKYKEINDNLRFVYLGSINNIIDIDNIIKLLSIINIDKKVILEVIGCGSSQDVFIAKAKKEGIEVNFHGVVFDDIEKHKILKKCHFGLNMMKNEVTVGLTTKSMDYLKENLPLINTIPCDTEQLIKKYNCGINIDNNNIEYFAKQIISINTSDYNCLASNAKKAFDENFSKEVYLKKLDIILKKLIKE